MFDRSLSHWTCVAAMTGLAVALLAIGPIQAQSLSIAGNWSGTGVVRLPSGVTETVKCRATFRQAGTGAFMNATCANPSIRVIQTAELSRTGGNRFTGEFLNAEYGITGSIRITLNGANSMSAALSGGGGSASITLSR